MSVVDEIKDRIDIIDLVSETVKLRHTGKNYTGFCPFHANTRTPAFVVFPDSQTWRCFGQCNEGGDIFKYVMKREGWDFAEALKHLAERAGVQLPSYRSEAPEVVEENDKLRQVLEDAQAFFHQQLLSPLGAMALAYLQKRDISAETIEKFGLGFAPDGWETLINYFAARHVNFQQLADAGLVTEREGGGFYDKFRNRLMIPIRDAAGKMTGFGGRVLNPDDIPKYMNSPKTALFDKSRLLYGLDLARRAIREADQVVIVEGYLDVIGLHQCGFANAVSPMGTALTEDQFKILKKITRRIILALDPDAAGEKATLRGLEVARQTMEHGDEVRFDARGLLHIESRLKADIRVVTLPDGKDPDEIVLEDSQAWQRIIDQAKPIVMHVMETLIASKDMEDAKVKGEIARQVLPLIEDVPDRVERETYRQKLAVMLRVDERALVNTGSSTRQHTRKNRPQPAPDQPVMPSSTTAATADRLLEQYCLINLLLSPEQSYFVDRYLRSLGLMVLSADDFVESDHLQIFDIIQAALTQMDEFPLIYIEARMAEYFPDWLEETGKSTPVKAISAETRKDEIINVILRLRRKRLADQLNHLIFAQSDPEAEGLESNMQSTILALIKTREIIDRALQQAQH